MWDTALQVTVCLTTLLHVTYPQIPPKFAPSYRVYNCSANGCGGQCMKGYCPYPYAHVNTDLCYCPDGMKCCKQRSVTTRCSQCSPMYRCVSDKVFCASPVVLRTCTCPKGQKCCKGPFCFECSGTCMKSCQHPFYQMIHQKCPCPVGMMCCREATCEKTCKNAKCVPEKSECRSQALNAKCTCPPGQKCCTLSPCLYKPCTEPNTCKKAGGQPVPAYDCPNGQVCCKGTCTCQHGPCTKMDMCVKLGGTIIPSLNCLNDTVCCRKGNTAPNPSTTKPGQCKKWLLLGATAETKPAGLHGLYLQVGGTSLDNGPNGLKAWAFDGKTNGVTVHSAGQLNFGKNNSFTVATYVYEDVVGDGPIINWKRKAGVWGTHLAIYRGKLYADLDPGKGSMQQPALAKKWVFAGVSFHHTTGTMLLWYGANAYTSFVGKADKDTGGAELYVGFNIYSTGAISKFTGKLAGTTVMNCSITKEQIPALEKQIIDIAKPAQCKQWVLLGPSAENKPAGLHGLDLQVHGTTPAAGPNGLKAWVFDGLKDGVTIQSAGELDFGKGSFTIATYVYQDVVREGPIVNWKQKAGNWGTLLWIAKGKLYADLDPGLGTTLSALAKKWVFAGVSFRHTTGTMLLWYGADVHTFNIGKAAKDTGGAVLYVGFNMYNNGLIRRFTGKLAGTTVMNCSITKDQIPALEKQIIDIAKPVQCKQWLLLGPTAETRPAGLHGLDLQVGGTSLTTGPNGLKAWVFNGKNNGVTVKSAGQLNLGKDSFTIATYVYQDVVKDGPIINWKHKSGRWGTLLWIASGKLYADLDPGNDFLPSAALAKQWVFAGVSFRHNTGKMLLWYGANAYTSFVGKADKDTGGAVLYVGFNIYSQSYIPAKRFTGKLAGTTVMNCSITKEQIPALEKKIINIAKPGQCKMWLLLGPTAETKPSGLHGLDVQVGGTPLTTGPNGLKAWVFNGKTTGVTVQSAGQLDLGKGSFTIATYVYQDVVKDGPIVNWKHTAGTWGTHLVIYGGQLYADLDPGKSSLQQAALAKQWVFAGVSFNRATGAMVTWYGANAHFSFVGKADKDTDGAVLYVGFNLYSQSYIPTSRFTGKLAGTTVMNCSITKGQIPALEKRIIDIAKPGGDTSTITGRGFFFP